MPGVVESDGFRRTLDRRSRNSSNTFDERSPSSDADMKGGSRTRYPNGYSSDQMSDVTDDSPRYFLEHLATFSVGSEFGLVSPKDGLHRLLQMEKSNGIWTQKMQMKLDKNWVLILDFEDGDVVEKFPMNLISDPTAYTSDDPRELYNNILVFIVREDPKSKSPNQSEMHIFQCARVYAQDVVDEMKMFMSGKAKAKSGDNIRHLPPPPHNPPPDPPINGNSSKVRDHVAMFSASAVSASPTHSSGPRGASVLQQRIERASGYARESNDETSSTTSDKYEREVVILNHCFDDIERFVVRLQHAAAAYKELERRQKSRKHKKKDMGDGMLSIRAKPPPEREFIDVLQKFKLSFNLLAKLKSHIHDPNAPELVHFLFTPLALIIDAARDSNHSANLAARVISPLLTRDAIELLANCCTSKETDLWHSLGDSWIIPRDQWKGYESNYQPIFSNGWAPELAEETNAMAHRMQRPEPDLREQDYQRVFSHPEREGRYDSEYFGSERGDDRNESPSVLPDHPHMRPAFDRPYDHLPSESRRGVMDSRTSAMSPESDFHDPRDRDVRSEFSSDSIEHSDLPLSPQRQFDHHQMQWLDDLKTRRAKIVQVVYPRTANNEKELTVVRGEILEVLDDSRKWWKARNMQGQVAHVPHTIVTPYPAPDDDVFNNPVYGSRNSRESYYSPDMSPSKEQYMDGGSTLRSEEAMAAAARSPPPGISRPAPADWVRRERQGKKGHQDTSGNITFESESGESDDSLPSLPKGHMTAVPQPPEEIDQSPPNWLPPPSNGHNSQHQRSEVHIHSKSKTTSHGSPNLTKRLSNKERGPSERRKNRLSRTSNFSTDDSSAHERLQEELKASIAQKKGQRMWKKVVCEEHGKTDCYYITAQSTKEEWAHWLKLKGFSAKAQAVLETMALDILFNSKKSQLEKYLDEEGAKLHSYLIIQKNMCGYKTCTSQELNSILAERRQRVEID